MKSRKTYYDFLRIVAAFCVIYSHLPGCVKYQSAGSALEMGIYIFIGMFIRIHVPIFFMISGALLLDKEEKLEDIFKNRILRMCVVLILFGGILYWSVNGKFVFFDYIRKLIGGTISGEYWFLYGYIAFLILLPYLRRMVNGFSHKDFICFFVIRFCVKTMLPITNYVLDVCGMEKIALASYLSLPLMLERMFFYPIAGYYVDKILDIRKITKRHLLFGGIISFVGIAAESLITIHQGITQGEYTQDYVALWDYVIALWFFVLVKYIIVNCEKKTRNKAWSKIVCNLGTFTFGMYLLDPIWRRIFPASTFIYSLEPHLPTLVVTACWCILSMCISGVVTWGLKKLPFFKKLL